MSWFRVHPPAIRAFARHITDCEQDASAGRRYLDVQGDLPWYETGTLLGTLRGPHGDVVRELGNRFDHLQKILNRSTQELDSAADYYDGTDADEARRMDSSYPAVDRPTRPR